MLNWKKLILEIVCVIILMIQLKLKIFVIDILIDKKPYKNILVYSISYKGLIDSKPLHITLDKIDGFIGVYDGTRYLVLYGSEKYHYIYNSIRYLISIKSGIIDIISYNSAKTKLDSFDSFPL